MRTLHHRLAVHALSLFLLTASNFTASALQIEFLDIGDPTIDGQVVMNAEELASVDRAAALWEDVFTDDITVAITISMSLEESASTSTRNALPSGQTNSAIVTYQIDTIRQHLIREANAGFEFGESFVHQQLREVLTTYPPGPLSFPVNIPGSDPPISCPLLDRPVQPSEAWWLARLTNANAKALGLSAGPDAIIDNSSLPLPSFDSHIALTITIPSDGSVHRENLSDFLDFDQSDGIDFRKHDFTAVVAHEIGHALGYVSGSDQVSALRGSCLDDPVLLPQPYAMDLWRFRPNGPTHADRRREEAVWLWPRQVLRS